MRILIFHGYLLRGTGSNIYNSNLAKALVRLGHDVDLLCQDRDWQAEGVTVHNPDIGRVLPVYVADSYDGFDAKPYPELSDAELEHYIDANVAAVRAAPDPDVGLANHLVMGPLVLARGLAGRAPYAAKVHGSALEYTVRPNRERFLPHALEGVRAAAGVLVGSHHTAASLWEVLADEPSLPDRTRLGPPGVDVHSFKPGVADLERLAAKLEGSAAASWGGEAGAAAALRSLGPDDRIVSYVGKLIVSKGVDLLLAAWPRVVAKVPEASLVVVGFGTYREAMGRFVEALRRADTEDLREIAARGRELEGGPPGELRYLRAFLDSGVDEEWLRAAPRAAERIHFTGRLEYDDLPSLRARLRGAGDAEHLPRGLRDGGRRGRGLRRPAAVGRALGHGRGHGLAGPGAARGAAPAAVLPGRPRRGGADRRQARGLAHARPRRARTRQGGAGRAGGRPLLLGERGREGDRGRTRAPRRSTASRFASG